MKINYKYIGIIIFLFCTQVTLAMLPQSQDIPLENKPEDYLLREPGEEFLLHFSQDPAFNYTYKTAVPGWIENFKMWFLKHFFWARSWSASGTWLGILLEIITFAVLFFLIYKLIRSKYRHSTKGKRLDFDRSFGLEAGQVNEVSYPVLLEQALAQRNYVLAIRIHYWYVLGLLDQQGVIRRDSHRSNAAYLHEISQKQLRDQFRELILIFDCVCYGEFRVDEELYETLRKKFNDFQQTLAG